MIADIAYFWFWAVFYALKSVWDDLPGPLPVKVLLIIACTLVPGPWDEIVLLAMIAVIRRIRKQHSQ